MRTKTLLTVAAATALALGLGACSSGTGAGASSPTSADASSQPPPTSSGGGGASSAATGGSSSAAAPASSSGAAGGSSAAGTTDCGAADSFTFASGGDVNIQNLWQKDLLPKFAQACPDIKINFTFDTHSQNANLQVAKVAAAEKSGNPPDVDLTDNFSNPAAQAGLTLKVTTAEIPNLANVNKAALDAYQSTNVPYRGSSVLLAYDSTKVTSPPKTLADLLAWIKANPGKFTYNTPDSGGSGYSFVETVIASKMSADEVAKQQADYLPNDENLWTPGLQELKSLTPSIYQNVYPNGNQAVLNLMGAGQIEMAPVWSDQFLSAQTQGQIGKEWKVEQISDPSFTGGAAYLAIIKGTKHAKAVETFVNWVLEPAQQASIVKDISGFPAIPLTSLPADAQGAFAGVDTQDLRNNFNSKMQADVKKQWTATVPG